MAHMPYGYRIENGIAVIDEEKAEKVRNLYKGYLSGLSLTVAAKTAGIDAYHGTAGRMVLRKLGSAWKKPGTKQEHGENFFWKVSGTEMQRKAVWISS